VTIKELRMLVSGSKGLSPLKEFHAVAQILLKAS